MPFEFEPLSLPGLVLIRARLFSDDRGYFLETYRLAEFVAAGITERFVQTNLSWSQKSVLRGIHYQVAPHAQGKLVQVLQGRIQDVVVDVQPASPTFKQWVAVDLAAERGDMLYVPPQYGHGFCVAGESALVCYQVTAEYDPQAERGVLWSDPALGISWLIEQPVVSAKDQTWPTLDIAAAGAG